jgi:hypothetical protein
VHEDSEDAGGTALEAVLTEYTTTDHTSIVTAELEDMEQASEEGVEGVVHTLEDGAHTLEELDSGAADYQDQVFSAVQDDAD